MTKIYCDNCKTRIISLPGIDYVESRRTVGDFEVTVAITPRFSSNSADLCATCTALFVKKSFAEPRA